MSSKILDELPKESLIPYEVIHKIEADVSEVVTKCTDQTLYSDEWLKSVPEEFRNQLRDLSSFAIKSGLLMACDDCLEKSVLTLRAYQPLGFNELSWFIFLMKVMYSPFERSLSRAIDDTYYFKNNTGMLSSYRNTGYTDLISNANVTSITNIVDYVLVFNTNQPNQVTMEFYDHEVTDIDYINKNLTDYDKYAIGFILRIISNMISNSG